MDQYPVLIGDEVAYFHDIDGGFDSKNGVGSTNIEAHLTNYYNLDCVNVRVVDDYPDNDYIASLRVYSYRKGEHSFSEALSTDVDKRETRYE